MPKKDVRPTQDKVRGALFSSLGAKVAGARVLDLFAGSGSLGLEAWSRGASAVCWVESHRSVYRILKQNVDSLCSVPGGEARCVMKDSLRFLSGGGGAVYDLILADPPYDRAGKERWLEKTLLALEQSPILAPEGILAFELSVGEEVPQRDEWVLLRNRTYGDTRLLLFAKGTR